jgi:hypothetical protein
MQDKYWNIKKIAKSQIWLGGVEKRRYLKHKKHDKNIKQIINSNEHI